MLTFYSKNEMLKGLKDDLTGIQLKYQDGTTSATTTEAALWGTIANSTLPQDTAVTFDIDTSAGTKNISGFKLLFGAVEGFDINLPQIYNYPNNGTFTFDGMSIVID